MYRQGEHIRHIRHTWQYGQHGEKYDDHSTLRNRSLQYNNVKDREDFSLFYVTFVTCIKRWPRWHFVGDIFVLVCTVPFWHYASEYNACGDILLTWKESTGYYFWYDVWHEIQTVHQQVETGGPQTPRHPDNRQDMVLSDWQVNFLIALHAWYIKTSYDPFFACLR